MPESRTPDPRPGDALPPEIARDLAALRDERSRALTSLADTMASVRPHRPDSGLHWRDRFMASENARRSAWIATAAAALLVAALVVPISYPRTTGHRVALTLDHVGNPDAVRTIAREFKTALHAGPVMVKAEPRGDDVAYTLETTVPAGEKVNAGTVANAFARHLAELGYVATAATTPVIERVSGTVYAAARDLVVQVSTDGKTSAQIESEIRQRFTEAGIPDAKVSVTDVGDKRKVMVEVQRQAGDADAPASGDLTLQLTKDGKTLGGDGLSVSERLLKSDKGTTLHFDVTNSGKSASFDIANPESLGDAALAAAVEAKLRAAGMMLKVSVTGGRVSIAQ